MYPHTLEQRFSNLFLKPTVSASPGDILEIKLFEHNPRSTASCHVGQFSCSVMSASKLQRENQALCAPLLGMQLHTQRYPRRIQDFPHILRLTRVLLQSKDLSMWFCLPLCVWVSGLSSNSVEIAPEKRSPRTTFPPGGKRSSQEAEQASLLRASRGSQLACVWKPLFGRNG